MTIVGNIQAVRELRDWFPRVSLLQGPNSVGKRTAAEAIVCEKGIGTQDQLFLPSMGLTEARTAVSFASHSPSVGSMRAVVADIDHTSQVGLDTLLLTLEDRGNATRFLLVSSGTPSATLVDRAQVFRFGLLSIEEVAQVLQEKLGFARGAAERCAAQSGGRVQGALDAVRGKDSKNLVLLVVRTLRENDPEALGLLADRWKDQHTRLLVTWAHEAVSGQWRVFTAAETGEVGSIPLRVLLALRRPVRPRLVIRAQLMEIAVGECR